MAKGIIKRMILSLYSENSIRSNPSFNQSDSESTSSSFLSNKYVSLRILITVLFIGVMLSGCKESISLPDFDNKAWQQDKGGCLGQRNILLQKLLPSKNKLKGYSTEDIVAFLGRPDKKNLYNRNQKFFYYYSEPGKHCDDPKADSQSKFISIRFSALDRATEIIYY